MFDFYDRATPVSPLRLSNFYYNSIMESPSAKRGANPQWGNFAIYKQKYPVSLQIGKI